MRQLLATLLAVLFSGAPALVSAQGASPFAQLETSLRALSLHAPGHVAMEIKDLGSGQAMSINANASMPAASTIKIPVMVEVFKQLEDGNFDLNTEVTLRASDKDWGSGSLCDARSGTRYPVSQLLGAMIRVSDNTATNMLIRMVGRTHINADMLNYGLEHTKLGDYIRSDGNGIRWALRSSPADMVSLLTQMANKELIDEWSSGEMIQILEGQEHNSLIPEPLPDGVPIAHKTGTLHDTLNDVGIVFADPQPYVIAVMTTNLPSLYAGRRFIRSVSRMAYSQIEHFASIEGTQTQSGDWAAPAQAGSDDTQTIIDGTGTPSSNQPAPEPTATP